MSNNQYDFIFFINKNIEYHNMIKIINLIHKYNRNSLENNFTRQKDITSIHLSKLLKTIEPFHIWIT